MRKNNFDQSSTGTNIELSCFYDTDLSRIYFDENFKILQHDSYYKNTIAYYIDSGNVPDDDAITFNLQGTLEQKTAFLEKEGYTSEDMPPQEDIDDCILDTYGERITLLNFEDFNKHYTPLQVIPSKAIEKVSVRGYSQGDYAEVIYCPDDLEKAWGNASSKDDLKRDFTRFFYDAPTYCVFTINENTYDYSELMPDSYEWDKEAFAKIVSEKSGVSYDTLLNMLPQYPDYL